MDDEIDVDSTSRQSGDMLAPRCRCAIKGESMVVHVVHDVSLSSPDIDVVDACVSGEHGLSDAHAFGVLRLSVQSG